jgi:hypothetical protein
MQKDVMQEISALWDKINDISKQLSDFSDMLHKDSKNGIGENEDGLLDIASVADENSGCVVELGELVNDLEERLTALESKEE